MKIPHHGFLRAQWDDCVFAGKEQGVGHSASQTIADHKEQEFKLHMITEL